MTTASAWKSRFLPLLASLLFSLLFTKYYFLLTHEHYEPASSAKMAAFEADKVFQKRVLPILAAKGVSALTGLSLDHALKAWCVLTCIALLHGFHALLRETGSPNLHPALAYLLFIPVGWNYLALNSIYHAYDLPTLAFFCWGIVLFLRQRYAAFYLLYLLAGLNRESICFITISLFALLLRLPERENGNANRFHSAWRTNRVVLLHCLAQTLLWFVNKAALEHVFRHNPGSYYEETLSMTAFLQDAWNGHESWPYLDASTFFGNPRCFLTLFAGIWLLLPCLWEHVPSPTKKLFWIAPPYLFAAAIHANLMETRVYHELNVVLASSVAAGLHARTKPRLHKPSETNTA